jgi:hypothetical protein
MSWKVEFKDVGGWHSNHLRFPRQTQAHDWGEEKFWRWTVPSAWRVTETADPATHWRRADGVVLPLDLPAAPLIENNGRFLTDATLIVIDGVEELPLTLREFFEANVYGIDDDEAADIRRSLARDGLYRGGGGAAAEWTIRVAPAAGGGTTAGQEKRFHVTAPIRAPGASASWKILYATDSWSQARRYAHLAVKHEGARRVHIRNTAGQIVEQFPNARTKLSR